MGITNPSGAARTTPIIAALAQGVLNLGGSGAKELLGSVHREQPPLQQGPLGGRGRGSLARLIYHTGLHSPTPPACRNSSCTQSLSPRLLHSQRSAADPGEPGKGCAFTLFHTAHQGFSTQLWSSIVPQQLLSRSPL